ncbi:LOW QUALITY PROTEIN: cingulin [Tachyglossus aculeatus]|uniref:LOW QUALITY PROTEIN: cingulin n=1 Tax=Tachyglossus aculeatus TaxID=9261 RepID=UPI0018F4A1D3|nr:LOW QUALITY PROTEIN: cingulin [Tachyglossus aculeatus]
MAAPVDHGVQIRFITESEAAAGSGGRRGPRRGPVKDSRDSSYGVAVRVQGIAGQPFVVLNSGQGGGDSFGVQIKGARAPASAPGSDSELPENPYGPCPGPQRPDEGQRGPGPAQAQAAAQAQATPATVDTAPLSSVDSLITKFDRRGGPSRSRARGRRSRPLAPEERKRSQSLDGRSSREPPRQWEPEPGSPAPPDSQLTHSTGSLGRRHPPHDPLTHDPLSPAHRSRQTRDWVERSFDGPREPASPRARPPGSPPAAGASRPPLRDPLRLSPALPAQLKSTPDLLRDQRESAPSPGGLDHIRAALYDLLREGSSESDSSVSKKVSLVLEHVQAAAAPPARDELAAAAARLEELQQKLDEEVKKRQKLEGPREPPRPGLELQLEDKVQECAHLQEQLEKTEADLRRGTQELQDLQLRQDQAERLRREAEERLGELRDELAYVRGQASPAGGREAQRKELLETREELEEALSGKQRLEEQLRQRERELTALKGALKEEVASRDQEVERVRQQCQLDTDQLRRNLQDASQERATLEAERQKVSMLVRELQRELEESAEENGHWQGLFQKNKEELKAAKQELLQLRLEKEELEEEMRERLQAAQREADQLRAGAQDAWQAEALRKARAEAEATASQRQAAVEATLRETQEENDDFRRRILGLEQQLKEARGLADGGEALEARLRDRVQRLEAERQRLQEELQEAQEAEAALSGAKRTLEGRLEEAQRGQARLGQEQQALHRALQDEGRQREALSRANAQLEEQKRLLDRTVDRLNKELSRLGEESEQALEQLQAQLEAYKDKARREVAEARREAKERASQAESAAGGLGQLQDESQRLRQSLQAVQAERESLLLDKELLNQQLKGLEQDAEARRRTQDDRARQLKALEDKVSRLEAELDEERNTVELLTDRVSRSRDQVDQLRAELLQERSNRQDLECDKISMERQNKDLKSRLANSEGLQKPSAGLSQLEAQIQQLQERLQTEEREKLALQSSTRKLERRVKELTIQIEDERQHVHDQKDQLSLRVKALKRQVDEAEEEIERLDGLRKKAQREVEEQHEVNEQLQARIKTLEKEAWRKSALATTESSLQRDLLSSDEEFDNYDPSSSITSLLTESNLQTSSC